MHNGAGRSPRSAGGIERIPKSTVWCAIPRPCHCLPGPAIAAAGADKAIGPARREQVSDARRLIREALLKLDQGAGKRGHTSLANMCSMFVLNTDPQSPPQLIEPPDAEG